MDIYIKPVKKVCIFERNTIYVKDITEVIASKEISKKIEELKILTIEPNKKNNYLISVIDIIKVIKKNYPDYTINNVGEMDTFVEYSPVKSKENKLIKWIKILFVSTTLFIGSSTAIMSFHSEAQMTKIFTKTYSIIFGEENEKPLILEIPYSFGLSLGIFIFFNHIAGKKITDDPTPIEVQMSIYDTEVCDTIVGILDLEKQRGTEVKNKNANN